MMINHSRLAHLNILSAVVLVYLFFLVLHSLALVLSSSLISIGNHCQFVVQNGKKN